MRKILVCQHVAYEILGTLDSLFKQFHFRIRYINFGRYPEATPSLDGYDGLVVLGGPMSVNEINKYPHLLHEMCLIEEALKKDIPTLGICLGAQLIAKTLGAQVYPNKEKEIGWYDSFVTSKGKKNALFSHFNKCEKVFQWHGDTFDLPRGAELLVEGKTCKNQAFKYTNKTYGLQFHLEVDEPMIERWLNVPELKNELKNYQGKIDPKKIREHTPLWIGRLKNLSNETFKAFICFFGEKKKYKSLPST